MWKPFDGAPWAESTETNWKRPFWFRWFGSVVPVILPVVLLMAAWAALVCVLSIVLKLDVNVGSTSSPTISSTVGFAISLLLVFRTNTGYERWYEGRRLFDTIGTATRMLTMYIHTYFPANTETERQERKMAVNLCIAFFRATKHHLRGQDPRIQEDMKGLLPSLAPNFQDPPPIMTQTAALAAKESAEHLAHGSHGAHAEPHAEEVPTQQVPVNGGAAYNLVGTIPRPPPANAAILEAQTVKMKAHRTAMKLATAMPDSWSDPTTAYFPIYILNLLFRYLALYKETHRVHFITVYAMNTYIGSLMSCFASLVRILLTPVPVAYAIHIRQCLLLYCLFLPFNIVKVTGWLTILIQAFTVYVLFGIEAIGTFFVSTNDEALEVENPFGNDPNDLPLDDLADLMQDEVEYFSNISIPWSTDWVMPGLVGNPIMGSKDSLQADFGTPFATGPVDAQGVPLSNL